MEEKVHEEKNNLMLSALDKIIDLTGDDDNEEDGNNKQNRKKEEEECKEYENHSKPQPIIIGDVKIEKNLDSKHRNCCVFFFFCTRGAVTEEEMILATDIVFLRVFFELISQL